MQWRLLIVEKLPFYRIGLPVITHLFFILFTSYNGTSRGRFSCAGDDNEGAGDDSEGAGDDSEGAGDDSNGAGDDSEAAGDDSDGAGDDSDGTV